MTNTRKKANAEMVALFWNLATDLMSENPSVVEGTIMNGRCLRVGKEFLALVDDKGAGLVVKLSKRRVEELVASGVGQPFAPAGRVFTEWVSVPKPNRARWRSLLQEGVLQVSSVPSKASTLRRGARIAGQPPPDRIR